MGKQKPAKIAGTKKNTTGNIGEWSEILALYKIALTGEIPFGKMNGSDMVADDNIKPLQISEIIRNESQEMLVIHTGNKKNKEKRFQISYGKESDKIISCDQSILENMANQLYQSLKIASENKKSRTFSFPEQDEFLKNNHIASIKAPSTKVSDTFGGKTDITLITCSGFIKKEKTFSIKSDIGSQSALVNSSKSNEVVYKLDGCTDEIMDEINAGKKSGSWLKNRVQNILTDDRLSISFKKFGSETYENNLNMISKQCPAIIANTILYSYNTASIGVKNKNTVNVTKTLVQNNPLKIKTALYEKNIKNFLLAFSLGMQSGSKWNKKPEITGGNIWVTKDGGILAFSTKDKKAYKNWLFENTKFDTPSTSRSSGIGEIVKENGEYLFKLGTLIKFV